MSTFRIGADIGGTFTDLVLVADDGSRFRLAKVLTTPRAPEVAAIEGVRALLAAAGVAGDRIAHVVHGTTLFTNALIERKGPPTALVATKGFRDAVEIGREHRYDMYDLFMERPAPLAPRRRRFEIDERVRADGSVAKALDEAEVEALAGRLKVENVGAVAVCLLHGYRNPIHEKRVGDILRARLPGIPVALSCEVVPEIREYERASTTLANVYVQGIAEAYLGRMRGELDRTGIAGPLYVMQSNGGLCDVETATRFPIRLVESGPAAGALAAAEYGRLIGQADLLSFDMGGTTAKLCVIEKGEPLIAPDFEIDRKYRFKKGSGLPVRVPVIEMIEIGAGGGSIARIDRLGRLAVGPDSAGSEPGPVAYGRGGTEPTVTDADLALGYLDPGYFLGGRMTLDAAAAGNAIARKIAAPLSLDDAKAAWAIHQVVNETMASAARIHAVERGKDATRFPLFAFGGAGPVHAWRVGRILRCPAVVYPLGAGVLSAAGFLTAPLAFDFVRTVPGPLEALDWDAANAALAEMEAAGRTILSRAVGAQSISFRRFADLRYRRQGFELRAKVPSGPLGPNDANAIRAAFEESYVALYGHALADMPLDVVSWRVIAEAPKPALRLPKAASGGGPALKGRRRAYMPEQGGFVSVPVYDRYQLKPGETFEGPAIVEEAESTVVLGPGARARIDEHLNLIAEAE